MGARLFVRMFFLSSTILILIAHAASAQELGGAGTVQGIVKDPTGAVMIAVTVTISNPVTNFRRDATTNEMGRFVFRNLPPNPYHLAIDAQGFEAFGQDVDVRGAVPITLELSLRLAGTTQRVEVVGHSDLIETNPTAHTDVDQGSSANCPSKSPVD